MERLRQLGAQFWSRVKISASQFKRWARDGSGLWIWLGVVGVVCAMAYFLFPIPLPDRVRWAGIFLEILGITTVAVGLGRSRQAFGKPSLLSSFLAYVWEARFIFVRRPSISAAARLAGGSFLVVGSSAILRVKGGTVEERIGRLESQVEGLEKRVDETSGQARALTSETKADLEKEAAERKAADEKTQMQLEQRIIGGVQLEVSGLGYLILGVLFANAPEEMTTAIQWLGVK